MTADRGSHRDGARGFPPAERARMYAALQERYAGLSLPKFLQARDEDQARRRWFEAIEEWVASLPPGLFVGAGVIDRDPVLTFAGSVTLSVDVWRLRDETTAGDRWNLTMVPSHVPVLIDAVGWARWGGAWSDAVRDALGSGSVPPLVEAQEPGASGWFVDGGAGPATLLWFEDHSRGERALRAFVGGCEPVAALYRRMSEDSHD